MKRQKPATEVAGFFIDKKDKTASIFCYPRIGYFLDLKSKCSLSSSMGKYEKLWLKQFRASRRRTFSFDDLMPPLKILDLTNGYGEVIIY